MSRFMMMGRLSIDFKEIGRCEAVFSVAPQADPKLLYVNIGDCKIDSETLMMLGDDVDLHLHHIVQAT